MNKQKANEEAENLRKTVRLSNAACQVVELYMALTGYSAGAVVTTLLNVGDLALKGEEKTVEAARKALFAQANLFTCQHDGRNGGSRKKAKSRKVAAKKEANQ